MTRYVPQSIEVLSAWLDGDDEKANAINASHPEGAGFLLETTLLDELAEIYGESTAFVSQNDIDHLRSKLSREDFLELCARLGWEQAGGSTSAA